MTPPENAMPDEPPPPVVPYESPRSEDWVVLQRLESFEAGLAMNLLHTEGIRAQLADQAMASLYPLNSAVGGVKLLVPREDAERARQILETRPVAAEGEDQGYVDEPWRCGRCHQKRCSFIPLRQPWQTICILLLGIPFLFVNRKVRCEQCGNEWVPG